MVLLILRQVSHKIKSIGWYTILADECRDLANREQFTICTCVRWNWAVSNGDHQCQQSYQSYQRHSAAHEHPPKSLLKAVL